VDATVYAEGLLLGTVLLGMSAGAAAYLGLRRTRWSPEGLLVGGLLLFALSLILWLLLAAEIAAAFEAWLRWTVRQHASAVGFFAVHGMLVCVVLGGPAGATGLGFPALCELAMRRPGAVIKAVGRVTAWHYVGAGVGAAATPFLLLPRLGMTWSLVLLSAVFLLTVTSWPTSAPWERGRRWWWGGLGVGLAALFWFGGTHDVTFRTRAAGVHNRVVLHHEDGTGIVEVYEDQQTGHRTLLSSRLRQEGGDRPEDLRVQRLQGALPVLLHPASRRLLVVGLGTGISLAASLRPEVERVTCVEISRGVIRAAALFDHAHNRVLAHPRVTLVHQDGRNFLTLTREHYDLIVQELFFPYRAGVGNLYTLEHYQRVRSRLAPHGRVAQWIALNQVGPLELRALVRTFTTVFPHTSLWLTGGYLLLYGGLEPLMLAWPALQQRLAVALPVEGTTSADVLGMFVSTGEAIQHWAARAPLNTDDNAFIEFHAPRAFATLNSVALAMENLAALLPLHRPVAELLTALPATDRESLSHASMAARLLWDGIVARARGDLERARGLYERAYALNPVNYQVRSFLEQDGAAQGREALLAGRLADAAPLLQRVLALHPQHAQAQFDLAVLHAQRAEHAVAVTLWQQLLRQHPEFPHARFHLGVSLYRLGRYAEAATQFARVVARDPTAVEATFNLANSLAQAGQYAEAVQ
jgi:spermidine synthase